MKRATIFGMAAALAFAGSGCGTIDEDILMGRLRLNNLQGIYPRVAPQLLAENQAQTAENLDVRRGDMRPVDDHLAGATIGQVLICGTCGETDPTAWGVSAFKLTVGGVTTEIDPIALAGRTSMVEIADKITTEIWSNLGIGTVDTQRIVTWDAANTRFILQWTDTVGFLEATGTFHTDISGPSWMNGRTGGTGVVVQEPATIHELVNAGGSQTIWTAYPNRMSISRRPNASTSSYSWTYMTGYGRMRRVDHNGTTESVRLAAVPASTSKPTVAAQTKSAVVWTRSWGWFYEEPDSTQVDIDEPISIRSATFTWTQVGATAEWYCEIAAGGSPLFGDTAPKAVYENTTTAMTLGTLGSLAAGEWCWALDNATSAYYTVYVNLTVGGDPGSQALGWVRANITPTETTVGSVYTLNYLPVKVAASDDARFVMWFEATDEDGVTILGRVYPEISRYRHNTDLQISGANVSAAQVNDTTAVFTLTYDTSRVSDYDVSRYYVYTFLDAVAHESAISPISELIEIDPSQDCLLGNLGIYDHTVTYASGDVVLYYLTTALNQGPSYFWFTANASTTGDWDSTKWDIYADTTTEFIYTRASDLRIYRTVTGTGGTAYQLVSEESIGAINTDIQRIKFLGGAAQNKGGGKVGFLVTAHGFVSGESIQVSGSASYDAVYTVDATTSANEIVVTAVFVGETMAGTARNQPEWLDTVADADTTSVLKSTTWDTPSDDLDGLVMHPSGALAGFVGNSVFMTPAGQPHAWPYEYVMSYDVVGLGIAGNQIIVLTTGNPTVLIGDSPDAMSMAEIPFPQACESIESIVSLGNSVFYASPDGYCAITNGAGTVMSKAFYTRDQWQALDPSSVRAAIHDEQVFLRFSSTSTLVFDFSQPGMSLLTTTDEEINALYVSLEDDVLYTTQTGVLQTVRGGATVLKGEWKSKQFLFPVPVGWTTGRIRAESYTASPKNIILKLYGNGSLVATMNVTSDLPFRIPRLRPERKWEFIIDTYDVINEFVLATSMGDVRR